MATSEPHPPRKSASSPEAETRPTGLTANGNRLHLLGNPHRYQPLEPISFASETPGYLVLQDSAGVAYAEAAIEAEHTFLVGGALGDQTALLLDAENRLLGTVCFEVACETHLSDASGRFATLFRNLIDTLQPAFRAERIRIGNRRYAFFCSWLRDHVHTLKAMRFLDPRVESGIDLYADWQREDGMIWDKVKDMFHSEAPQWRDIVFGPGDFVRPVPGAHNATRRFQRIPAENDVEYLFIEGLYLAWKAGGDTAWMARHLDAALKALRYATSDRYRWSEKYGLLKRAYTIDTWDFQAKADAERVGGEIMVVDPEKTVFGIMHGDNTGMMASCRYLAEMLEAADRADEAEAPRRLADTLKERLDALAWNGAFYRHHVSEEPSFARDFGNTDESAQVSLSNAYALGRGLPQEQCAAILRTYLKIRDDMPASSPGEFYSIYPPFEKGFNVRKSEYMNGGVPSLVAGELARGAFHYGFETYGVDILERVNALAEAYGGHLHGTFLGREPDLPEPAFTFVDLREAANTDVRGEGAEGVPGWIGEGDNDLVGMPTGEQRFHTIPFEVIDPAENHRRACLGLSIREGYAQSRTLPIAQTARSLCFLHASNGKEQPVGLLRFRYEDGTSAAVYMKQGREVGDWFTPPPPDWNPGGDGSRANPNLRVAWNGPNRRFPNVGVWVLALDNPHPEKAIRALDLEAAENGSLWLVLALSLSDQPARLPGNHLSHGIPDIWGAAAVFHSLLEGLVGVLDRGVAFDHLELSPRWMAAGENEARAAVVYPRSGGYVSYRYRYEPEQETLRLDFATCADTTRLRLLLPGSGHGEALELDGRPCEYEEEIIETSRYACLDVSGRGVHACRLRFRH